MFNIWAIARQTFAQCLHMRMALMFIILLAIVLVLLPIHMDGDGTLAGKIRSFLSYGLWATQILLILITIFATTDIVCSDVRAKQIFTIATKPVTRSQYILGRWLGVVLLNVVLLSGAATACYAVAQYLRTGQAINAQDVQAVETEVFSARHRVFSDPPPIEKNIEKRLAEIAKQGQLESAIEEYMASTSGDRDAALNEFRKEIRKQETEKFQTIGVGQAKKWRFSGVDVKGRQILASGKIGQFVSPAARILIDPKLVGQLVSSGPVDINGVKAHVISLGRNFMDIRFDSDELVRSDMSGFISGKQVKILIKPAIQLHYTVSPSKTNVPGNVLKSRWVFINPSDPNIRYAEPSRDDPPSMATSLTVPAGVVSADGTVDVIYQNLPNMASNFGTSVRIPYEEITLLYRAGGFEGNYIRGVAMVGLQLIFIAAVAVVAGSFTSFPVACLMCFGVLPFAMAGELLTYSLRLDSLSTGTEFHTLIGHYTLKGMQLFLPNMALMSPGRWLVDGLYIPWGWPIDRGLLADGFGPPALLPTAGVMLFVRTSLLLGIACLIFHKRELAKVQV